MTDKLKFIKSIKINKILIECTESSKFINLLPEKGDNDHLKFSNDYTLNKIENLLIDNLKSQNIDFQQGLELLIRQVAVSHMMSIFYRFDAELFDEQIKLLMALNFSSNNNASIDVLYDLFIQRVRSDKSEKLKLYISWDKNMFLKFLLDQELIIYVNNHYEITYLGKDYLASRTKRGIAII